MLCGNSLRVFPEWDFFNLPYGTLNWRLAKIPQALDTKSYVNVDKRIMRLMKCISQVRPIRSGSTRIRLKLEVILRRKAEQRKDWTGERYIVLMYSILRILCEPLDTKFPFGLVISFGIDFTFVSLTWSLIQRGRSTLEQCWAALDITYSVVSYAMIFPPVDGLPWWSIPSRSVSQNKSRVNYAFFGKWCSQL